MADLTGLTNDELAQSFVDHFAEVETRMASAGVAKILRKVRVAHALMADVAGDLVDGYHVSPNSVGGDKP